MSPARELDGAALRANAGAYAALGAPVAAVVKHDGYGWGAARLVRELDPVVDSYVVSDEDELDAVRPWTRRTIRMLGEPRSGRLARVADMNAIPSLATRAAFAEATALAGSRPLRVAVGILDAAGWNTISPADAPAAAAALAGSGVAVELWTHLVSERRSAAILAGFREAERAFVAAGLRPAVRSIEATASAGRAPACDLVRIGVGLFGARLGAPVAVRSAIRVRAPVVRRFAPGEIGWAGYGDRAVGPNRAVEVVRCGYGDGFPKALAGSADIISVGMQYTALIARGSTSVELLGAHDDLDELAMRAGVSVHELVVGLAPR